MNLNHARLPIPPHPHIVANILYTNKITFATILLNMFWAMQPPRSCLFAATFAPQNGKKQKLSVNLNIVFCPIV